MTPTMLLMGIDYILNNRLPTGDGLLAHLKMPKGIGALNASMLSKYRTHRRHRPRRPHHRITTAPSLPRRRPPRCPRRRFMIASDWPSDCIRLAI
jgi:hypothetical protein